MAMEGLILSPVPISKGGRNASGGRRLPERLRGDEDRLLPLPQQLIRRKGKSLFQKKKNLFFSDLPVEKGREREREGGGEEGGCGVATTPPLGHRDSHGGLTEERERAEGEEERKREREGEAGTAVSRPDYWTGKEAPIRGDRKGKREQRERKRGREREGRGSGCRCAATRSPEGQESPDWRGSGGRERGREKERVRERERKGGGGRTAAVAAATSTATAQQAERGRMEEKERNGEK